MPTHKVLCDLDVGGEVKGTSLDINGAADIAGNLVVSSGGDITCGDDLFMPSGGVINFNSGDVTITHSSNQLAVSGGNLTFNFAGTNYNIADSCTFLDSEDNELIVVSENQLDMNASAVNFSGTVSVAGDIVHVGDSDTKIGFGTNSIRITCGNTVAVTHTATGSSILKREFGITGSSDGAADGDIVYFGGTTSMTTGAIYHYKSDGTWELADADSAANCDGLLGVALGSASDTNGVLLRGMVTLDHDPGAVGDVLFLSTTAGDATATAPSGNGDIVRVIGYCLHASNGQIFFNPDGTFVEVTA